MTLFGTDISSFQAGLDVAQLPDTFVLMKCTEDVSYTDADYPGWLSAVKASGKIPVAYHFIGPSAPAAQAAHLAAHIIDPAVPVMVDFENEGSFHPTLAQLLALDDAIKAASLRVKLNYFPKWKWGNLGSPSLAALSDRGIGLVSSNYPNLTVAPAGQVYAADGGDSGPGWNSYGGVTPTLWQFSDRVSDGGQRVDMNAYRGTAAQLAAFLGSTPLPSLPTPVPTPTPAADPEDDLMPAFNTGVIAPGAGAVTVVLPPPANYGGAGWGNVWFSLGCDFGKTTVRVAIFTHGQGWSHIYEDVLVDAAGDRVNPFGGPLPTGVQKISITRGKNPGDNSDVPLAYLVEAVHR